MFKAFTHIKKVNIWAGSDTAFKHSSERLFIS
jgi:hypothetical protein